MNFIKMILGQDQIVRELVPIKEVTYERLSRHSNPEDVKVETVTRPAHYKYSYKVKHGWRRRLANRLMKKIKRSEIERFTKDRRIASKRR